MFHLKSPRKFSTLHFMFSRMFGEKKSEEKNIVKLHIKKSFFCDILRIFQKWKKLLARAFFLR